MIYDKHGKVKRSPISEIATAWVCAVGLVGLFLFVLTILG
jgi:hypothetical protein